MSDQPVIHDRRSDPRGMNVRGAVLVSSALATVSFLLSWAANEATDKTAIAGGIGLVLAGSLLGLSILAARWDRERLRRYVETRIDDDAYEPGASVHGTEASARDGEADGTSGRASAI